MLIRGERIQQLKNEQDIDTYQYERKNKTGKIKPRKPAYITVARFIFEGFLSAYRDEWKRYNLYRNNEIEAPDHKTMVLICRNTRMWFKCTSSGY